MIKDAVQSVLNLLPDEAYLKFKYRIRTGSKLNLKHPETFNEKLQWLKLHDRKPEYTTMVDKAAVKDYVAEKIGAEYLIPTLGVWDRFEDIDFEALPDQFVLKCTHDSGGLVICRDKTSLDMDEAKKKIEKSLKTNYFYRNREWSYQNVPPRILAESYMQDRQHPDLPVYKFFCFHGTPRIIQVIQNDKRADETIDYFDPEWNRLELRQNYPNSPCPLSRPDALEQMRKLAQVLAEDRPFVRVDLYLVNGQIYFSEYTFYSDAGFSRFRPEEWDKKLGSWITLPGK